MANWCNNTVFFYGDQQKIDEIDMMFNEMAQLEKQTRLGQLPPFLENGNGYLHDIYVENGTISYETKWVPNTDILINIADHFQTGFFHEYYEPGMWIYGQATYQDGILTDISLDQEEIEQVVYDENEGYIFEGKSYENDMEVMELLLERKKSGLDSNNRGHGR